MVGATHAASALGRVGKGLGFRVTVGDPRGAFATSERFPGANEISRVWPDEAFAATDLDAYSYVVALTHDPRFDIPTLARALRAGARYIGAMGSQRTHERREAQLRAQGFGAAALARIRAPIGPDIDSRTPEDIKEIVYTMRYDTPSAKYAQFGPFYIGYIVSAAEAVAHLKL